MTDILIGAADLYNWDQVAPWVVSARKSGFSGDIYLICYRVDQSISEWAWRYDVNLYHCDHTPYSGTITHAQQGSPTQAHNYRFYHAWELLTRLDPTKYEYCIMTDVRDVIFQTNPSNWLRDNGVKPDSFIAPSEGILFEKEEWNRDNLIKGFGQVFYDLNCKSWAVCNVGTIAGGAAVMNDLFHLIFSMTEGRYYPSDQSSFNVLVEGALSEYAARISMRESWAAQMGTTNDPTKAWLWDRVFEPRPIVKDGKVYTHAGEPFCIVHQWDRVPELKATIPREFRI